MSANERKPRPRAGLFEVTARLVVGLAFVAAAVLKTHSPDAFAIRVAGTGFVPNELVSAVAIVLPWLELTFGVTLVVWPSFRAAAAACIATLLLAFIVLDVQSLMIGRTVSCGCFGGYLGWFETPVGGLVRNLVLMTLAIGLFMREERRDRACAVRVQSP